MNKLISTLVATVFVAASAAAFAQDKLPPTAKDKKTPEGVSAAPAAGAEATVEAPKAKAKAKVKKVKAKKSKESAETK